VKMPRGPARFRAQMLAEQGQIGRAERSRASLCLIAKWVDQLGRTDLVQFPALLVRQHQLGCREVSSNCSSLRGRCKAKATAGATSNQANATCAADTPCPSAISSNFSIVFVELFLVATAVRSTR